MTERSAHRDSYHILELGRDGVGAPARGVVLDYRRLKPRHDELELTVRLG